MTFETSFRRLRAQMHAMERTVRMMRMEVENALIGFGVDDAAEQVELRTGLSRLMTSDRRIDMQEIQPYAPFSEGCWISYDESSPGTRMVVGTRGVGRLGKGDRSPAVARLSVNPVFSGATEPLWCTLETEIDPGQFREATTLQLDLIAHFEINRAARKPIAPNCNLMIRLQDEGGERRDVLNRFFPVTSMPLEQSIVYGTAQLRDVARDKVKTATLILMLPTAGDYVFNLDHFSLHMPGA